MGVGVLEAVQEEGAGRGGGGGGRRKGGGGGKSRLLAAYKRRVKEQSELVERIQQERDDHLRAIQSQLMVLESQLRRRQREMEAVLEEKEATIRQQQHIILSLSRALHNAAKKKRKKKKEEVEAGGKEVSEVEVTDGTSGGNGDTKGEKENEEEEEEGSGLLITPSKSDPESLNDSDSAIMLEDSNFDSLVIVPLGRGEVKVVRSVSDVVEVAGGRSGLGTAATTTLSSRNATLIASTGGAPLLKPNLGARPGSLSTSSCSSEDSDESPTCTLTKSCPGFSRTVYSLKEEQNIEEEEDEGSGVQECDRSTGEEEEDGVSLVPSMSPSIAPSLHSILKSTSSYDSDATLSDGESDNDEDEELDEEEEEDGDEGSVATQAPTSQTHHHHHHHHHSQNHHHHHHHHTPYQQQHQSAERRQNILGSYEKLNTLGSPPKPLIRPEEEIQVTYNRVMSNHRSVTKPKDVKYRRINKAKSRSLEELRGKLKCWNERAGKHSLSVDLDTHSFA